MQKITSEELNKKKKELQKIQENIEELTLVIDSLKQEDVVKRYVDANEKYIESKNKIEDLQEQIKYQNMLHCNHYFVINDVERDYDGHPTGLYTVTCIHCGLTNKFMDQYNSTLATKEQEIMNEIFINNNCYHWNKHGKYSYQELSEIKKIYDKFTDEYPNAKDNDVEKYIALVKKMRGGKLC